MPSVFLSYSRDDLSLIQQLEDRLKAFPDISIWRDQEKIYGGQKWPKVLGEAIADQDVFLLAWSKNAAASHFVEFEWCTAIALKKTIMPCLLDNTPLAHSLKALHTHGVSNITEILTALRAAPPADAARREPVIHRLSAITEVEGITVLEQTKTIFSQQQWAVQGNVYQAGGDIYIHETSSPQNVQKSDKPLIEKWQTWVAIVVGILTTITLAVELPKKFQPSREPSLSSSPPQRNKQDTLSPQPLAGSIRDEDGDPLPNVQVSLPRFNLTNTTDQLGQFRLEVTASHEETIALLAQKSGYQPHEMDVTLGNTSLGFTMRKRK